MVANVNATVRMARGRHAWLAISLLVLGFSALALATFKHYRDLVGFIAGLGAGTGTHASADAIGQVLDQSLWLAAATVVLLSAALTCLMLEIRRRGRSETALQRLNNSLEATVEQRTEELNGALAQIRSFASELDRNIEAERRRLAREVHDQLGQVFTSLQLLMISAGVDRERARSASQGEHALSATHTGTSAARPRAEAMSFAETEIRKLLAEGVEVARRITHELRPALLDDFGLAAAVSHYAENQVRLGGTAIDVEIDDDHVLTPGQANQLFRIVQEAVVNVERHAGASRIVISSQCNDHGYHFSVADDGNGPGPVRADANGLKNMRQRADLAGGSFRFGPGIVTGSVVTVDIPSEQLLAVPAQEA